MVRYIYKDVKYDNLFTLRQAIWESASLIFGDLTNDLKEQLGITEEEYDPKDDWSVEQWESYVRSKRNALLAECDYFVMPDYPASDKDKEVVKKYRQELRDISEQKGFPKNVVFPEKPTVLDGTRGSLGLAKVGI